MPAGTRGSASGADGRSCYIAMMVSAAPGKRSFWADALKYLPSIAVSTLVGMLLLPVMTRLLAPKSYGNYAIAFAALNCLQMVASTWLNSSIIRFHAGAEKAAEDVRMNSTAFVMTLAGSAGMAAVCLAFALALLHRLDSELCRLLLIVPAQLMAMNLLALPLQVLRAQRRLGAYNILIVSRTFLPPAAGASLSLMTQGGAITMFATTAAVHALLVPAGYWGCFRGKYRLTARLFDWPWARQLLAFGMPLVPAMLMVQVLDISDRFIIGAFRGSTEAGLYAASYTVAALPMDLVMLLVTGAAAPLIVATWEQKGRRGTELFLTFLTRVFILLGLPAAVGLAVLSRDTVTLFANEDYAQGATIVPYVSAGAFLLGLQWIAQRGMLFAQRTKTVLVLYTIAGLTNIAANIILVPRYGFVAAGWTTLGSYVLLLVLIAIGSAPHLTWNIPYATAARATIAVAVMRGAILLLSPSFAGPLLARYIQKVLVGALVYGISLVVVGEFPLAQIRDWRRLRRGPGPRDSNTNGAP
jgi:O-antigen/teichoic acid export membrane protein